MNAAAPRPGPDRASRLWVMAIAAAQGLLLWWLYETAEVGAWPSDSPLWAFPWWTLAIPIPLVLQLAVLEGAITRVMAPAALLVVALLGAAFYTGWQAQPGGEVPLLSMALIYGVTIGLAVFKATLYLQRHVAGEPLRYPLLFTYSWRNFLTVGLALAFVAVTGAVLALWAALFAVIGIRLFADLFSQPGFFVPVLALTFALGLVVFRNLTGVIDGISRLLEGLIRLLLPLLVGITLVFLAVLPFVGLTPLWETGYGTALLLWLTALLLFFVNAVYRTGDERVPYPLWVRLLVCAGIPATPLLSALSLYCLWLRVDQYGLTVERCWALVVWALLTVLSLGYTWGVARRGLSWPRTLATVNVYLGMVLLALMLLVNSPLLDFRKLSLASQVARVERGEMDWREFDFLYARHHLGRPAYRLMADLRGADPELAALIDNLEAARAVRMKSPQAGWNALHYRPEPFEVPEAVRQQLNGMLALDLPYQRVLVRVDLDRDGAFEYALLGFQDDALYPGHLMYDDNGLWRIRRLLPERHAAPDGLDDLLLQGEIQVKAPRFGALDIGGLRFEVK